MKLAVCISGLPRFGEGCYESLRDHILSKYDCDIFVHYWGNEASQIICDTYQPIVCNFEPQIDFKPISDKNEGLFAHGWSSFASASMFYSLRAANLLKQKHEQINNFTYDYVIRTRFDVKILSFFEFLNSVDKNQLHVASNIVEPIFPMYSDILWLTSSKNDDIMCDVYSHYKTIVDSLTVNGRITCNEEILYAHVNNRVIRSLSSDITAQIIRGC